MFLYSTVSTLKPEKSKTGVWLRLTNCGNSGDDFAEFELVQNGGFTGSVETDHQDSHLLLGKEPRHQTGDRQPHFASFVWIWFSVKKSFAKVVLIHQMIQEQITFLNFTSLLWSFGKLLVPTGYSFLCSIKKCLLSYHLMCDTCRFVWISAILDLIMGLFDFSQKVTLGLSPKINSFWFFGQS